MKRLPITYNGTNLGDRPMLCRPASPWHQHRTLTRQPRNIVVACRSSFQPLAACRRLHFSTTRSCKKTARGYMCETLHGNHDHDVPPTLWFSRLTSVLTSRANTRSSTTPKTLSVLENLARIIEDPKLATAKRVRATVPAGTADSDNCKHFACLAGDRATTTAMSSSITPTRQCACE
jgi:hypothetical protein